MIVVPQNEWNARFKILPEDIKEVLMSAEDQLAERINKISKRYIADEDTEGVVAHITSYLIMRLLTPTEFVDTLTKEASLSRENATLLAQEINRDILNPIRDSLLILDQKLLTDQVTKSGFFVPTKPAQATSSFLPPIPPKPRDSGVVAVPTKPSLPATKAVPTNNLSQSGMTPTKPESPSQSVALEKSSVIKETNPLSATQQPEFSLEKAKAVPTKPDQAPTPIKPPEDGLPRAHVGNIFEEKLNEAFRMKSEVPSYTAFKKEEAINPQTPPIAPIAPQAPVKTTSIPQTAGDPYREPVV